MRLFEGTLIFGKKKSVSITMRTPYLYTIFFASTLLLFFNGFRINNKTLSAKIANWH